MFRTVFALFLSVAAAGALAAEPMPAESEAPQCEKEASAAGKSTPGDGGGSSGTRPGTSAPVRPRTSNGRTASRWHSMLPGMIR